MEERYRKILEQCRKIALELKLPLINKIVDIYEIFLLEEKTLVTFIEVGGASENLAMVVKCLWGEDIFKNYLKFLRHKNEWCVRIEYGEEIALYKGDALEGIRVDAEQAHDENLNFLTLTIPAGFLQNKAIILLNAGDKEIIDAREIATSEEVYLLINAVMAMTEVQKRWIAKHIPKYFDVDRFFVCLAGAELLADEDQERQVIAYIHEYLNQYPGVRCVKAERGLISKIQSLDEENLKNHSRKRIIKNMLHEIIGVLEHKVVSLGTSEEEYDHLKKQLEKYRDQLAMAGKITVESVLDNQIRAVINAVNNSAEEYGDAVCNSIHDAIMTAKNIEEVESRICSYMEHCWEYFARETSAQVAKDFEGINNKVLERMEEDIHEIMMHLDMKEQALLEQSMNFVDVDYVFQIEYDGASDDALRKVSKNARNMMILSIPLLFVSPALSVTALVSGGIYSRLGKKSEDRKYREELLSHVEKACQKAKKDAVKGFTDTLNAENSRMKNLIYQGYQNLIDLLKDELDKRREKSVESMELLTSIQRVLIDDIPTFMNKII